MAPPPKPAQIPDCKSFLPDQKKWSHDDKKKHSDASRKQQDNRKDSDYQNFFDTVVEPLNKMAVTLQVGDVLWLLALSARESGWLNDENDWLHNLFGLTAGGHDNLGFDSVQQSVDYWTCRFGPYIKGVKNLDDFVEGLKNAGYNENKAYFDMKGWHSQVKSVETRFGKYGYEKAVGDNGTMILRKKK